MIYLLRHGQTEWNRDRRLQGQGNSELTVLGREQAVLMADLLAREISEPKQFRLVSSPLQRARETAEVVAGRLGLPVEFDARLAEIALGEWEGRFYREVQTECAALLAGTTAYDWFFRAPGGESLESMVARIGAWLQDCGDRPTIAVGHGLSGRIVRGLYAGLDREAMLSQSVPQDGVYRLKSGALDFISATGIAPNPWDLSTPWRQGESNP
jgi:broad specificity phosphatase PhoE